MSDTFHFKTFGTSEGLIVSIHNPDRSQYLAAFGFCTIDAVLHSQFRITSKFVETLIDIFEERIDCQVLPEVTQSAWNLTFTDAEVQIELAYNHAETENIKPFVVTMDDKESDKFVQYLYNLIRIDVA